MSGVRFGFNPAWRAGWVPVALIGLCTLVAGCASTSDREVEARRSGSSLERVSPVRAADANTRLGMGYFNRGDVQIAMEKLELAVRQDPDHAPAHMSLGIVYQSINRNEKALEHLKIAVGLAPEDGAAHNTYAVLLCRVGRYAEADRHFRAALEDPFYQTPEVVLANAGSCARRAGETEQAERYLRQALEFNPRLPEALFNLAEISLRQGRALPARGFLQRLESGGALSADALLLAIRIEQMLQSETTALQYARRLIERYPNSPQASEVRSMIEPEND